MRLNTDTASNRWQQRCEAMMKVGLRVERFNPEAVDLAVLARVLEGACGESVVGAVVGRTQLRDVVIRHLGCSQLEGEQIVDTMVGRGFLAQERLENGLVVWRIRA
ncbi:MAG: hypothetical protein ABI895_08025 [Deltaproteobacteria bacterium]